MMKVTWGPTNVGTLHKIVEDADVVTLMHALNMLGWNPTAEIVDNDAPKV